MNSFFASVEQQLQPKLRGRPVAVAPVQAETTCCIAASYEAKRFGIKTGTPIYQARRMCRGIRIVPARPAAYIEVHHKIIAAVQSCLPVERVLSIDEMACRISPEQRHPETALRLARQVKQAVRDQVGEYLRSSIGIAPNQFLAKVAADMHKPDGLTLIQSHELPNRLHSLELMDLPGIGLKMARRLHRAGIERVDQFCRLSAVELSRIWGSRMHGGTWWHQLRGDDLPLIPSRRFSVGNSHVLPPELRTPAGARGVLIRLLHKAAARLRHLDYFARYVSVSVECLDDLACHADLRIGPIRDTLTLIEIVSGLWPDRFPSPPMRVSVTLADLIPARSVARSLFPEMHKLAALSEAMDWVNHCYGANTIYFGGMHGCRETGHTAIAFTQIPDLALADA